MNGWEFTTILTWGLDLSGSMQGAGGVGGLLFTEDLTTNTTWHHHYDGNGNVTHLTNASGQTVATYTYDAFGNTVTATGTAANKYRFSTKPIDETIATTPLYYYGYRYYTSQTGRWINRDPIEEKGGLNLYGFVGNDGVGNWDLFGMRSCGSGCCFYKEVCTKKINILQDHMTLCDCIDIELQIRYWNWLQTSYVYWVANSGSTIPNDLKLGQVVFIAKWKSSRDCMCVKDSYCESERSSIKFSYQVDKGNGYINGNPRLGETSIPMLGCGDLRMTLGGITNIAPTEFYTGTKSTIKLKFSLTISGRKCKEAEYDIQ